jgi:hypothetical protein
VDKTLDSYLEGCKYDRKCSAQQVQQKMQPLYRIMERANLVQTLHSPSNRAYHKIILHKKGFKKDPKFKIKVEAEVEVGKPTYIVRTPDELILVNIYGGKETRNRETGRKIRKNNLRKDAGFLADEFSREARRDNITLLLYDSVRDSLEKVSLGQVGKNIKPKRGVRKSEKIKREVIVYYATHRPR